MANLTLSRAVRNTAFPSLSVFPFVVAATRLAFLCNVRSQTYNYTTLAFWLSASVALAAAAVSSYRVVLTDLLCERQVQRANAARKGGSY